MKKCKSCQTEIDSKAKKCPHCQADQRVWFAKHKILTLILTFIFIAVISSMSGGNKNSSPKITTKEINTKTTQTPEIITAKQLADDFDANQVSAEANWDGKLVEFSAKITNITDSGISFSDVASKEFSMVQIACRVNDKEQLMSLKNGQTIKVRGIVGKQTIGVIDVSNCEVIQ
jgi:hypothetical protein